MSIMGSIFSKVFDEDTIGASATPAAFNTGGKRSSAQGALTFPPEVDVEAALTRIAAKRKVQLDWRRSIVDLLKVLSLDFSLTARRQLAYELGYSGSMEESVAMNMWLHREVMRKLSKSNQKVLNAMGN